MLHKELVTLVGPGSKIMPRVRILGPLRSRTQVMLSSGASARKAGNLQDALVDLAIIAIIDELAGGDGVIYRSTRKDGEA